MQDSLVEALLGGIVGSVLTAFGSLLYSEAQRRRDRSGIRAQIVFLLRQLQVHMGMTRDYPRYYFHDVGPLVTRLIEQTLTPLSASGLSAAERDVIFSAASQADSEATFLKTDRQKALEHGEDEYIRASADRAFDSLQAAREAICDSGTLSRPVDPRALHNWHAGDAIPGSTVV